MTAHSTKELVEIIEEIEEERRMFYVAMTRAKNNLKIMYVKERYNKELEMSRFVREIMGKNVLILFVYRLFLLIREMLILYMIEYSTVIRITE